MGHIIGNDIGGTFTDTVVIGSSGEVLMGKAPSTPSDSVQGVIASLDDSIASIGIKRRDLLSETDLFLHGTTVVLNALLTIDGARVGILTTKGFADTLFIARSMSGWAGLTIDQARHRAEVRRPVPVIPPSRKFVREVVERMDYKGAVTVALDDNSVRMALGQLLELGIDTLAVCLLWSFKNPAHELRIREIAAELAPGMHVTLSSQLVPKSGEYERMASTAFNSAMSPIAEASIGRLVDELKNEGYARPLYIMQGNGGVMPSVETRDKPVQLIGSGVAGGVLGAKLVGESMGLTNIICTDVGGTSFDVGLIVDGAPALTPNAIVCQHTLHLPRVDVVSVGAGGGSIARVRDDGGMKRLTVGPDSAGAQPGPVCFGQGGTEPTVTDADLVLGLINPKYYLGGKMQVDVEAARRAIEERIAKPLRMTIEEAALGISAIIDNKMKDLIRQATVERGFDVRSFSAFLYGGGGPLHGTAYAAGLGLRSMVIPGGALASVFSAWGIATADIHYTIERSESLMEPFDPAVIADMFRVMENEADARLGEAGVPPTRRVLRRFVEMRYGMQTHQLSVPVDGELDGADAVHRVIASFEGAYERRYGKGSGFREAGVEITTFIVQAYGILSDTPIRRRPLVGGTIAPAESRRVLWPEIREWVDTPVYRGEGLAPGIGLTGPAIIELASTTVALRTGQALEVDATDNYIIREA